MCGIFGWHLKDGVNGKKKKTLRTVAALLMTKNDLRGGDSWGWFSPTEKQIHCGLGDMIDISNSSLNKMLNQQTVIAHTRKATTGKIDIQNCHPFDVGYVVGAHNGIVYNHDELNNMYNRDCAVDSEHIFYHIEEELDLKEIEAYGAITYHHRCLDEFSVFLGRFNNGDLAVCRVPNVGIFWSSVKNHLQRALEFVGWGGPIAETEENILYGIKTEGGISEMGPLEVGKPTYSNSMVHWDSDYATSGWHWNSAKGKFDYDPTKNEKKNEEKTEEDEYSLLDLTDDKLDYLIQ